MRRTALALLAAATAVLGVAACDPTPVTTTTSTGAPVPATTVAGPAPGGTQSVPATAAPTAAPVGAGGDATEDVEISACEVDGAIHWPSAALKVTNHTDKSSNYLVQVEFVDASGTRVAEAPAATDNLAAGQSASLKARGATAVKDKVSCRVTSVTRFPAP
ncbi:FxLYD domain-containing protein [Kitasatospora sp. NPDC059146]|uniref:FxLYD domain-containing protein n=1 Tax=Kitasatospora sp. NPDC059146 TaxID=3346741 RepID=UPI0036AFBD96